MSTPEPPLPQVGEEVETACGGVIRFVPEVPRAVYQGRWVYFCLPSCKRAFESDPDAFMRGEVPHE